MSCLQSWPEFIHFKLSKDYLYFPKLKFHPETENLNILTFHNFLSLKANIFHNTTLLCQAL